MEKVILKGLCPSGCGRGSALHVMPLMESAHWNPDEYNSLAVNSNGPQSSFTSLLFISLLALLKEYIVTDLSDERASSHSILLPSI